MSHATHPLSVGHEFIASLGHEDHGAHTEHLLMLFLDGQLTMQHRDVVTLEPGQLLLIPAGTPHGIIRGSNVRVWWLSFCCSCLELDEDQPLMAPFRQIRRGALPIFAPEASRQPYLVTLFKEVQRECALTTAESPVVLKSLLLLLLNEVKKAMPTAPQLPASSQVADALTYIQQHCLTGISLKDVATAVHRSPGYLATQLKRQTGYSAGMWITRYRLTEACARLLHTDDNIELIAAQVGWQDVTHFIRQFRKAYGQTPAAWRKQQAKKNN